LRLDVDHEADAARVVLVRGIVEALGGRLAGERWRRRSFISVPFVNSCTILPEESVLVSSEKMDGRYQIG